MKESEIEVIIPCVNCRYGFDNHFTQTDYDVDDPDPFYPDAVALARSVGYASVMLLHTRLRITYGRAKFLLDVLQDKRVVEPHADSPIKYVSEDLEDEDDE